MLTYITSDELKEYIQALPDDVVLRVYFDFKKVETECDDGEQ